VYSPLSGKTAAGWRIAGNIYPAVFLGEILKALFNGVFDGNHRCETADIKNLVYILF
jgi:hypothetical protein